MVSVTVKDAAPPPFVTAVPDPLINELPEPAPSATVSPATGLPAASLKVTVIVAVVVPSSGTVPLEGLTLTDDAEADTTPPLNVTVAVWVTTTESVVSMAV